MLLLLAIGPLVCGDSLALRTMALEAKVPPMVLEAVAYVETRCNVNPLVRGPGKLVWDSTGTTAHRRCREVGRLQLNPCAFKLPDSVRTSYTANVQYGAIRLRWLYERYGSWTLAIKRYNGAGPRAEQYLGKILYYIGQRTVEGL